MWGHCEDLNLDPVRTKNVSCRLNDSGGIGALGEIRTRVIFVGNEVPDF